MRSAAGENFSQRSRRSTKAAEVVASIEYADTVAADHFFHIARQGLSQDRRFGQDDRLAADDRFGHIEPFPRDRAEIRVNDDRVP